MFDFIKSIGVGIAAAWGGFFGAFNHQPAAVIVPVQEVVIQTPVQVPVVATSTATSSPSKIKTEVKTKPVVNVDNSAEIRAQVNAALKAKEAQDAYTAQSEAVEQANINAQIRNSEIKRIEDEIRKDNLRKQEEQNRWLDMLNAIDEKEAAAKKAERDLMKSPECLAAKKLKSYLDEEEKKATTIRERADIAIKQMPANDNYFAVCF